MTLITFVFFTALVGFLTWRATRRDDHGSSSGYFLAGRSLPWIVVGGSLLLTNLSTEQLVGLNGNGLQFGMQVMAWEVWSSIAIVLMALVFLPRYLKGGVATVSEFLERRYNRAVGVIISVLLLLSLLTNLLPFVLYSGAIFLIEVFQLNQFFGSEQTALWITVFALGGVGAVYAIFGGLKAVAVSDTLNGIGLLIGGLLIPIAALTVLGDRLGEGGFGGGIDYLFANHPEKLNPVDTSESANIPFSTLFTGMLFIVTYYWCTNQAIVQRTFGSKSLAEGQKGVLFAAFMKLLGPLYLVLPGIIAFHLYSTYRLNDESISIDQLPKSDAILAIQADGQYRVLESSDNGVVDHLKKSLEELSKSVGKEIIVEGDDGSEEWTIQEVVPAGSIVSFRGESHQKPQIISGKDTSNYLAVNQADKSYGKLALDVIPSWVLGFFAAVIFGAILSSFNSGLNSATTLFSVDLYKGLVRRDASETDMVRAGKVFGIFIAIGAIAVAPLIAGQDSLFDAMKKLAALYNIPLLAVVVAGIFSKRMPSMAAIVAILTGFVFYAWFGLLCDNHVFGHKLHWLHVAGINFVFLLLVMGVIRLIKPRKEAYVQVDTKDVDLTHWRFAKPVGIAILFLIGLLYFVMSRVS